MYKIYNADIFLNIAEYFLNCPDKNFDTTLITNKELSNTNRIFEPMKMQRFQRHM